MRLTDRVTLITGAAGAGIGQGIARLFAGEGSKVIVSDANEERAKSVALSLGTDYGAETLGICCDVSSPEDVEKTVRESLDRFGRIDVLVNNAGTNRPAPIIDMTDETWDLVQSVCLKGTFLICRAVLPSMISQKYGRIINIASTAAFAGLRGGHAHYAAAKAGVMAFTRCLAMEYADSFITANTIAPGFISNEFIPRLYPEEEIKRMEDAIPYPRKGTSLDIAKTALFLAADGEYLTGQTICVSGGSWMH